MSEVRMVAFSGYSRVADYLFGRNAPDWRRLPDAASNIRLCHLERILDFILGVQTTPGSAQLREFGGLSLSTELFVIAIVIALTFLGFR